MTVLAGIGPRDSRPGDRPLPRVSGSAAFPALALFALPLLATVRIELVGTLLGSDILVLGLLPLILASGRFHLHQPFLGPILGFLALWLLGAVLSDLVADTSLRNMLRGWAAIVFFGLTVATVSILVNGQPRRLVVLLLGLGLMYPLQWLLGTGEVRTGGFFDPIPWKFGTGIGLTLLAFLLVPDRLGRGRGPLLLLVSPVHLFLNARSLFLETCLAALLSTLALRIADARTRATVGGLLLAAVVIGAPLAEATYGRLATSGTFGEAARGKYLDQTAGGQTSLFVGGRPELLVSLRAVADSPILGHGSWAESLDYRVLLLETLQARGFAVRWEQLHSTLLIPSHSHLMGSWITHGALGALFWILATGLLLRALHLGLFGLHRAEPVELFVLVATVWSILFSPFGLHSRVTVAIALVVAAQVILRHRQAARPGPRTRGTA